MSALMRFFYLSSLAMLRFDLAIARSTGRNPEDIAKITGDIQSMEGSLLRLEINHVR